MVICLPRGDLGVLQHLKEICLPRDTIIHLDLMECFFQMNSLFYNQMVTSLLFLKVNNLSLFSGGHFCALQNGLKGWSLRESEDQQQMNSEVLEKQQICSKEDFDSKWQQIKGPSEAWSGMFPMLTCSFEFSVTVAFIFPGQWEKGICIEEKVGDSRTC